jgi:hypothetical protein
MGQKLVPVEVPWRVAPSDGLSSFSGTEGTVAIRLIAFFGKHAAERERLAIERTMGTVTDDAANKLGYREVELRFPFVSAFRMMPPSGPAKLIDEARFDWSGVPLHELQLTAFSAWRDEHARRWAADGRCPDPRFYQVIDSELLEQLGLSPARHKHLIVLGHDAYCDVVCREFSWEVLS